MAAALIVSLAAALLAALLVSGTASTNGRVRVRHVASRSFTSTIDARWTVRAHRGAGGYETLALSSTRAHLDSEGIPPEGAIGITLAEGATATLASRGGEGVAQAGAQPPAGREGARAQAAVALLAEVVRTPAGAQGVELSGPPRFRTLAGSDAAEESYEYAYRGRGNVQVDVVATRNGRVYFIELDTELARIAEGESELSGLLRSWHWR